MSASGEHSERGSEIDIEEVFSSRARERGATGDRSSMHLHTFLADVGVFHSGEVKLESNDDDSDPIFESAFDLTPERLQSIFDMFDNDGDGLISYEELRQGLEFHTAGNSQAQIDDRSFATIVKELDMDDSGDISFAEFVDGIQLLLLQSLVAPSTEEGALIEALDYNTNKLERRLVIGSRGSKSFSVHYPMSLNEFYFQKRPDWAETRWINVVVPVGTAASSTMNRLAVKYRLHPLAVEDSLSSVQRPKAELYANLHYFLMFPVFCIERVHVLPAASSPRTRKHEKQPIADQSAQIQVRVQMTSIFVTVPKSNTIITFTNGAAANDMNMVWVRVQNSLQKSYSKLRQYDGQYLTYALLDSAVDLLGSDVETLRETVLVESQLLRQDNYKSLGRVHHVRGEIEKVVRKLKPFMRMLVHVIEDDAISPGATVYLRDVLDNLECCDEELKQLVTVCSNLDSDAEKFQSLQMDRTLYMLTIVSAVFLPAQFLTGVYGMNFAHMPQLQRKRGYYVFWVCSVCMMAAVLLFLNFGRLRSSLSSDRALKEK